MSTRAAGRARQPAESRGAVESLRVNLLARYGADPEFGDALEALYQRHYASGPAWLYDLRHARRLAIRSVRTGQYAYGQAAGAPAAALLEDVAGVARAFGLDALGADYAAERIHRWCILRRDAGHPIGADSIVSTTGGSYAQPMIRSGPVEWRPNLEPKIEAEARARAEGVRRLEARQELATIEASWTEAGFTFHKSRTRAIDHLEWLYRRLRYRETYGEIAERWSAARPVQDEVYEEAVAKSVGRFLKLLEAG